MEKWEKGVQFLFAKDREGEWTPEVKENKQEILQSEKIKTPPFQDNSDTRGLERAPAGEPGEVAGVYRSWATAWGGPRGARLRDWMSAQLGFLSRWDIGILEKKKKSEFCSNY